MEALLLARIQFAANISFHILFPTITIALGWVLLYFRIRANHSDDPGWIPVSYTHLTLPTNREV